MARAAQKELTLPSADFRTNDHVQVIDREATPEENKSRIFYNHMRGLTGTVRRVYEEENEVWVDVDVDSLPEDVKNRHRETEDGMRKKWLDNLSDDARRKLSDMEKKFSLRYSILTTPNHLILKERGEVAPSNEAPAVTTTAETARRKTSTDLTAAEQEFLDRAMSNKSTE